MLLSSCKKAGLGLRNEVSLKLILLFNLCVVAQHALCCCSAPLVLSANYLVISYDSKGKQTLEKPISATSKSKI